MIIISFMENQYSHRANFLLDKLAVQLYNIAIKQRKVMDMRKEKKQRNYYQEINNALKNYEEYKPWHNKSIDWICNRIDWCWKFRHITKEQMEELTDRCCKVLWRDAGNVRNRKEIYLETY